MTKRESRRGKSGEKSGRRTAAKKAKVKPSFADTQIASTEEDQTRDRRAESRELDRPGKPRHDVMAKPAQQEGSPTPAGW
jgi:hypothetical protein